MRNMARCLCTVFALAALGGCAARQDVADPNRITLKQAMLDTVDALEAVHEKSVEDHTHLGFYGCTITAAFNVSATAGQDNKLALTAQGPGAPIFPVTIGGSASTESTASGTRGNTVTLVLATPYCLPTPPGGKGGKGGKGVPGPGSVIQDVKPKR